LSYYLDLAKKLQARGEGDAAEAIRQLYENKVELEKLVSRISEARDLLIHEKERELHHDKNQSK
jgi:hypothetical protein